MHMWFRQRSRFPTSIRLRRVLSPLRPARCYQHGAAGPWQVVTLIAGSIRQSLLMAGDDDEMFMTRSLNVTPKTTKQHLIVRSDKPVAYVTNNKRLLDVLYYWSLLLTYTIARPLCDSRTSCFIPPCIRRPSCIGVLVGVLCLVRKKN